MTQLSSATVHYATILNAVMQIGEPCTHHQVTQYIGIDPTTYDMSTRLWNITNAGHLSKIKKKGERLNYYAMNKSGETFLVANSDCIQPKGQLELIPAKEAKPRKTLKKPAPIPKPEPEPILSVPANKAFEEMSALIEANDKMNTALEKAEGIFAELLDEINLDAISVDILGMPLIDARKKKWKGLFASIAQLVFDNADTHSLITDFHLQLDEVLREKYGHENENEAT